MTYTKNKVNFFSILVYIDRLECLDETLEAVLTDAGMEYISTEILLLDPYCSVESAQMGMRAEEENAGIVRYIPSYQMSMAEAYNYAMLQANGIYVNFSISSARFGEQALRHFYDNAVTFKYPSLMAGAPWTVNEIEFFSQYLICPRIYDGKFERIDLKKSPGNLNLCLHAYFIRKSTLVKKDSIECFEELGEDTTQNYIARLLASVQRYVYISYAFYHYKAPMEDNTSAYLGQYEKAWYLETMEKSVLRLGNTAASPVALPEFVQRMILWTVYSRLNCNYNDRNKGVLDNKEREEFYRAVGRCLRLIEEKTIWTKGKGQSYTIPRTLRVFMLNLRSTSCEETRDIILYGDDIWGVSKRRDVREQDVIAHITNEQTLIKVAAPDPHYYIDRHRGMTEIKKIDVPVQSIQKNAQVEVLKLSSIKKEQVILDAVDYRGGSFHIFGRCSLGDFDLDDQVELFLRYGDVVYATEHTDEYPYIKLFGKTFQEKMRFYVSIPDIAGLLASSISFFVRVNGQDKELRVRPGGIYAHVTNAVPGAYWRYSDQGCMVLKGNRLHCSILTENEFKELEGKFLANIEKEKNEIAQQAAAIRREVIRRRKEQAKRIWITFDKLYKAGDSGEYMTRYITGLNSDVDIYYSIKEDAPDYGRMIETYGDRILVWGTDETIIKVLMAECVLGTHANIQSNAGISKELAPYLMDLFNPVHVCIQHGLTVQNIAQFQNRLFDHTSFYCCASQHEVDNLSQPIYGYAPDRLQLTGIARYDGLVNADKKQILITPTWRRNIANSNIAHFKKAHNAYFKSSEYFRLYNRLINDEELIRCAKEHGYRIIYLIHPAASSQIDDFDRNDYVEIIPAAGDMNYEKILTESSLMVTDYSGIQFDFAYMEKPLVYYHPSSIPPHYSESEFYKYEKDAFGPVVDEHEGLIKELCDYIRSGCVMKQEYKERVREFFAYHDHKNCERIYQAVEDFLMRFEGTRE